MVSMEGIQLRSCSDVCSVPAEPFTIQFWTSPLVGSQVFPWGSHREVSFKNCTELGSFPLTSSGGLASGLPKMTQGRGRASILWRENVSIT